VIRNLLRGFMEQNRLRRVLCLLQHRELSTALRPGKVAKKARILQTSVQLSGFAYFYAWSKLWL
jgi:hypothetical protein